tara:strand:+ start:88 stop:612 length:525 start_codon:yes stop_codon:yes gene_type:complete
VEPQAHILLAALLAATVGLLPQVFAMPEAEVQADIIQILLVEVEPYLLHMALAVPATAELSSAPVRTYTALVVAVVLVVIPALVEPAETMLPLLVMMVLVAVVLEVDHRILPKQVAAEFQPFLVVEGEQEYMAKAQTEPHLQMDGGAADQAVKVVVQITTDLQADLLLLTNLLQ